MTYTKEQLKELLRQQRENCVQFIRDSGVPMTNTSFLIHAHRLLDAPEPELPEVEAKTEENDYKDWDWDIN